VADLIYNSAIIITFDMKNSLSFNLNKPYSEIEIDYVLELFLQENGFKPNNGQRVIIRFLIAAVLFIERSDYHNWETNDYSSVALKDILVIEKLTYDLFNFLNLQLRYDVNGYIERAILRVFVGIYYYILVPIGVYPDIRSSFIIDPSQHSSYRNRHVKSILSQVENVIASQDSGSVEIILRDCVMEVITIMDRPPLKIPPTIKDIFFEYVQKKFNEA
jgi:hypothetical protein